jgi:hypothetical protein
MAWTAEAIVANTKCRRKDEIRELQALRDLWNDIFDPRFFVLKSVRFFLRELAFEKVHEAIELTEVEADRRHTLRRGEDSWLYFCKICWNWIRDENGGSTTRSALD